MIRVDFRSKLLARWAAAAIVVLAVTLVCTAVASACPTCKDALAENDPNHANVVRGYFYSILFMMAMPFLLLGSFGSYMYLEVRRARRKQEQAPDGQQPPSQQREQVP